MECSASLHNILRRRPNRARIGLIKGVEFLNEGLAAFGWALPHLRDVGLLVQVSLQWGSESRPERRSRGQHQGTANAGDPLAALTFS